jgi:hypothetical protein
MLLARLAGHYYRPDFPEVASLSLIADLVEDLREFAVTDIEWAINTYRKEPPAPGKAKYFPDSGTLRKLASKAQHARIEASTPARQLVPEFGNRPRLWWMQPKQHWQPHWRESEVPVGEMVRDEIGGKHRQPVRA